MGLSKFLARLFGKQESQILRHTETVHQAVTPTAPGELAESERDYKVSDIWTSQIKLSSVDLIHMAQKLKVKGELYRAEQLLRDGVREALNNQEYWALLLEIEEPLNRKGRAYYCLENILKINPDNTHAQEKYSELKAVVDGDLSYYIEYKLAPEFYKLQ